MTRTKTEFKPLIMADVEEVEVVVAHNERATLRVGDVFLKIDADQSRTDVEVEAMAMAPIPTPEVLWRKPPVLALAALPGTALGRLGEPSAASEEHTSELQSPIDISYAVFCLKKKKN